METFLIQCVLIIHKQVRTGEGEKNFCIIVREGKKSCYNVAENCDFLTCCMKNNNVRLTELYEREVPIFV